jgi:beta-1,4-mannosyltransferase
VPYQQLLADALGACGVSVDFLSEYRRGLPLSRALRGRSCDVFHLHWPEAYYPRKRDGFDWIRNARFGIDLRLAIRRLPFVITAHNLIAHNRASEAFVMWNSAFAFRQAGAVVAHSVAAKEMIAERFGVIPESCHVIPCGDLSVTLGEPLNRCRAREQLRLAAGKTCLIFGAVEPYKGIEGVISAWPHDTPDLTLAIVGKPVSEAYGAHIARLAESKLNVVVRLERLADSEIRLWLSAVDCVVFNYQAVFTSGAACLARSYGIPLLIPVHITTVDLGEPHATVIRFHSPATDMLSKVRVALNTRPDFSAGRHWRRRTSWTYIAQETAAVYRRVLDQAETNGLLKRYSRCAV